MTKVLTPAHTHTHTHTHVHWVSDAIQPSHPLSPASPLALSISKHHVFPMSLFFASGAQSIEASASAPVLPVVVQWLRICLPVQGTWFWSLVQEDPTCCGADKPVCHGYWAHTLELMSHIQREPVCCNSWSTCTWSLCSPTREATARRRLHKARKSSPCRCN